jgi:hypothetical protein
MKLLFENWRKHLNEDLDSEIEYEEEMAMQMIQDELTSDLGKIHMDWISDEDYFYETLSQLKQESRTPDEFALNIKDWLNSIKDQVGYTNLGDAVLK